MFKGYKRIEDFPKTYQRHFAPAVKEMVREWILMNEEQPAFPSEDNYTIDQWLADTSFDIADRRLGMPTSYHPAGEAKHFRMMDWRTLVEEEALRRIRELPWQTENTPDSVKHIEGYMSRVH